MADIKAIGFFGGLGIADGEGLTLGLVLGLAWGLAFGVGVAVSSGDRLTLGLTAADAAGEGDGETPPVPRIKTKANTADIIQTSKIRATIAHSKGFFSMPLFQGPETRRSSPGQSVYR